LVALIAEAVWWVIRRATRNARDERHHD